MLAWDVNPRKYIKTIPHGETMIHNVPKGTPFFVPTPTPRLHVGLVYPIPLGFNNNAFIPTINIIWQGHGTYSLVV